MISATLTRCPTPVADAFLGKLEAAERPRFWERVRRGHYLPLLLSSEGNTGGLMVASLLETDRAGELRLELATTPGWAKEHRRDLLDLVELLAERLGASRITFEAKRPGWERLAEDLGFTERQRITRYERTV